MSSHDAVDLVRRLTGLRKVGHGGTLDPFATGLLLILVGKATRFFDLLAPLKKTYRVTVKFGARSTTGDVDGEISPVAGTVTRAGLEAALPRFTGLIQQKVPAFSAVKRGGVPLYKLARRGRQVDRPVREVEVCSLDLAGFDAGAQQAVLDVRCSKGTYIRTLCEDIGAALGTGAYAARLRRTAVGELKVESAATPKQLTGQPRPQLLTAANPSFLSCWSALYFLPVRELSPTEIRAVSFGQPIAGSEEGPVRLGSAGRLLAVYGPGERQGFIRPLVMVA